MPSKIVRTPHVSPLAHRDDKSDGDSPVTRPRHRVQYRLRNLITAIVVVGAVSGLAHWVQSAQTQRQTIIHIQRLGGVAFYERVRGQNQTSGEQLRGWWPEWLFGGDIFYCVKSVGLGGTEADDDDLASLANLVHLKQLNLHWVRGIGDGGLAHLAVLSELQELNLSKTQVTDAGLVHLAELVELQVLNLSNTQVTDAGLTHLARLRDLQVLWLNGTRVTDDGVAHLKPLDELRVLTLVRTHVTDSGLEHLAGLPNLHELYLHETAVTSRGVERLRRARSGLRIFSVPSGP